MDGPRNNNHRKYQISEMQVYVCKATFQVNVRRVLSNNAAN